MSLVSTDDDFAAIKQLIDAARQKAYAAVNTTLIELYWQIGETLSRKLAAAEWGEGTIVKLAQHIAQTYPGLRGFTRPNQYRMRSFMRRTAMTKLSHHWRHNCPGRIISSS